MDYERLRRRFTAANDYAGSRGFCGGYPNGHELVYDDGLRVGTILLRREAVVGQDLPAAEIGDPATSDVWARFSRTHDWAQGNGFLTGFPNFHEADYGAGKVYGTIFVKQNYAEWRDVPAAEIGNPDLDDVEARFRGINDYAGRNGFTTGIPNGHTAVYGGARVYGAYFMGSNAVEWRDLGGPIYEEFGRHVEADYVLLRSEIPGVDGWVSVRLGANGTVLFRGHVFNGRIEAISFRIRVVVRAGNTAIVLFYEGGAGGFASGDPREENWEQNEFNPMVGIVFSSLSTAVLEVAADVEGTITGFLEDAVTATGKWIIGGYIVVNAPILVIAIGIVAVSAIIAGNASAGARIVGGTLWFTGPSGTLIALASEGVASLGANERQISDAEYDWANNTIFDGRLPPRERIVITDSIGGNNRAFVWPRFDGFFTVNLGSDYSDPVTSDPTLFAHELTHVWQLANTMSYEGFIAAGAGTQTCQVLGKEPYNLPAGTPPFRDLNIEQQAQVVQVWMNELPDSRPTHVYNRYIVENIRTGML